MTRGGSPASFFRRTSASKGSDVESVAEQETQAPEPVAEPAPDEGEEAASTIQPRSISERTGALITEPPIQRDAGSETIVRMVYRGPADVAVWEKGGTYRFRRGEPVDVPSSVAEELLTTPFERFEVAQETSDARTGP